MNKLVVLASGSGTNFQAILDAIQTGSISANVSGLITNNPEAGAIQRAHSNDIPVKIISTADREAYENQLLKTLLSWNPDLIVLAGFLKKIPESVVDAFDQKIINIHPALLPKFGGKGFYGVRVHQAVIKAGEKESGCTVHYVNQHYDDGDIIEQVTVPVTSDDDAESLAKKVLQEEHKLLPRIINQLLTENN